MIRTCGWLVVGAVAVLGGQAEAGVQGRGTGDRGRGAESTNAQTPGIQTVRQAGLLWTYSVTAEGRQARNVSVGDHGSFVFSDVGGQSGTQRLLSAFDDQTPDPLWASAPSYYTIGNKVASAEASGTHVSLDYTEASFGAPRRGVLSKFSSTSSVPQWTYVFPMTIANPGLPHGGVGISRDGKTIVAWIYKSSPGVTVVAAFDATSGTPVSVTEVPTAFDPSASRLSADGTRLVLFTGLRTWVYDVPSHSIVFEDVNWHGLGYGNAISGDGETFAKSVNDKSIEVYRRQGTTYTLACAPELATNWQCGQAALSDSGNVLACAWSNMLNATDVRLVVYALSGTTYSVIYDQTFLGSGTYYNYANDIDISDDGSVVALAMSGLENDTLPQLQVVRKNALTGAWGNALAYSLPGSVWDVDLSADGRTLASANSIDHAQEGGNGGEIRLFDLSARDLVLEGVPHRGSTVYLRQYVPAGSQALLYVASKLASHPHDLPGVGFLYLHRGTLSVTPTRTAGNDGLITTAVTIPDSPTIVGTTIYYQGLELGPPHLSESWIAMTVVP